MSCQDGRQLTDSRYGVCMTFACRSTYPWKYEQSCINSEWATGSSDRRWALQVSAGPAGPWWPLIPARKSRGGNALPSIHGPAFHRDNHGQGEAGAGRKPSLNLGRPGAGGARHQSSRCGDTLSQTCRRKPDEGLRELSGKAPGVSPFVRDLSGTDWR